MNRKSLVEAYVGWIFVDRRSSLFSHTALRTSRTMAIPLRRSFVLLVLGIISVASFAVSDTKLRLILERAQADVHKLPESVLLKYWIFQGQSAFRDTSIHTAELCSQSLPSTVLAMLFLIQGDADAAHEVLLGVLPDNLDEAEYAATHRGETDWADRHPLSDAADLIHSVIHRLEGTHVGEGGHTGYENAKYWLAGGPKKSERVSHPLSYTLLTHAKTRAPQLFQTLCPSSPREYSILAGGGKRRTVHVPAHIWDGFAFIDLCQESREGGLSQDAAQELRDLEQFELMELLGMELEKAA